MYSSAVTFIKFLHRGEEKENITPWRNLKPGRPSVRLLRGRDRKYINPPPTALILILLPPDHLSHSLSTQSPFLCIASRLVLGHCINHVWIYDCFCCAQSASPPSCVAEEARKAGGSHSSFPQWRIRWMVRIHRCWCSQDWYVAIDSTVKVSSIDEWCNDSTHGIGRPH